MLVFKVCWEGLLRFRDLASVHGNGSSGSSILAYRNCSAASEPDCYATAIVIIAVPPYRQAPLDMAAGCLAMGRTLMLLASCNMTCFGCGASSLFFPCACPCLLCLPHRQLPLGTTHDRLQHLP